MKYKKLTAFGLSALTIIGSGIAIVKRRDISDWLILQNYQPLAEIERLASTTELSDYGRKLFYISDPKLLGKDNFNLKCTIGEESIVLGCFDGDNIYIYDITDEMLFGVEEVTAAHEMLHAAYERLDDAERLRIDLLTKQIVENSNSQRLGDIMDAYRRRDPSTVNNEAHSIVGTEVRDLPEELERYYARYFSNREKVVDLAEKYESVFMNLKNRVESLDADLLLRKAQIEEKEEYLQQEAETLQEWERRLNTYKARKLIEEYNSELEEYNDRVRAYNSELENVKTQISEYNQQVAERNNIAIQQNRLINSLDSRATEL